MEIWISISGEKYLKFTDDKDCLPADAREVTTMNIYSPAKVKPVTQVLEMAMALERLGFLITVDIGEGGIFYETPQA